MTYHVAGGIFVRTLKHYIQVRALEPVFFIIAAWIFAWGEIYGTTFEQIQENFHYEDMDFALSNGALFYSCYFIVSFPMVFFLDETKDNRWTVKETLLSAFATGMIGMILLDIVCQYIIVGWPTHPSMVGK